MKKRVFSALLCLVMVIGLLPGIALADQKAAPEAPAATQIPMTYTVYCKGHGTESVNLIWDTFEIGDVAEKPASISAPSPLKLLSMPRLTPPSTANMLPLRRRLPST